MATAGRPKRGHQASIALPTKDYMTGNGDVDGDSVLGQRLLIRRGLGVSIGVHAGGLQYQHDDFYSKVCGSAMQPDEASPAKKVNIAKRRWLCLRSDRNDGPALLRAYGGEFLQATKAIALAAYPGQVKANKLGWSSSH